MKKVLYIERRPHEFVSIEKAFRAIADQLGDEFDFEFVHLPYGNRLFDIVRNLVFLRRARADIYHITGHVHYISLRFPPPNTVLSIMDIRFVHMHRGLRRAMLRLLFLDLPVRRLKYVTVISEQIRREVLEATGCVPSKVRTLELPLLGHFERSELRPFDQERPTILQVGTMENKNIPRLAEALSGVFCHLRIIGRLSNDQSGALEHYGIEYSNDHGLSDDEMRNEYTGADIVAFCSTYEGFGLPIIEAQAMGKPVVTSNISPMKETSGEAAVLVDPFDVGSIREGFIRTIDDPLLRDELVSAGLKNVERFSPERVASGYRELYREILNEQ